MITIYGLVCVLVSHILIWLYAPDQLNGSSVPKWVFHLGSILHLIYMNFDNMDGKQARRTKTSSPLGLLFDHACDSMIVTLQSISISVTMNFANEPHLNYFCGAIPFFVTCIEQYYTRKIYLPIINGAAEGCFMVTMWMSVSGIYGSGIWDEKSFFNVQNKYWPLYFLFICSPVTVVLIFKRIYDNRNQDLVPALQNTLVFIYLMGIVSYHFTFTEFGSTNGRILLYIAGANFSKLCGLVIMAHVSNSNLNLTRWSNILVTSLLPLNLIYHRFTGTYYVDHAYLMRNVFIVLFLCLYHVFFCTTYQFTNALNIKAFTIPYQPAVEDTQKTKSK